MYPFGTAYTSSPALCREDFWRGVRFGRGSWYADVCGLRIWLGVEVDVDIRERDEMGRVLVNDPRREDGRDAEEDSAGGGHIIQGTGRSH